MVNPKLTKGRIFAALGIAVVADLIQLPLTAVEATGILAVPSEFADFILDVLVMATTTMLLGFHVALLPTVFVELVPGLDLMPTWTGCVAFVVWRRKQEQQKPSEIVIDVEAMQTVEELLPPNHPTDSEKAR